jgi:hypothetical protein
MEMEGVSRSFSPGLSRFYLFERPAWSIYSILQVFLFVIGDGPAIIDQPAIN